MKTGLILCNCGHTQDEILNFEGIKEAFSKDYSILEFESLCLEANINNIINKIREQGFESVVFGACTPKLLDTLLKDKLNDIPYEIVPLKEHCALPHADDKIGAAKKALSLLKMNLENITIKQKLKKSEFELNKGALIIGGGIAGIVSANLLSDNDIEVHLVEKTEKLGGMMNNLHELFPKRQSPNEILKDRIEILDKKPNVLIHLNSQITEIKGYPGNYLVELVSSEGKMTLRVGVIIVATGIKEISPNEKKLYSNLPDVINQSELAMMLKNGKIYKPSNGEIPKSVLIVNCVGSREAEHPNCSVICCSISINHALALTELAIPVTIAYMDVRAPYMEEIMYQDARSKGVTFIKGVPASVEIDENSKMLVSLEDTLSNRSIDLEPDLIVISGRLEPNDPSIKILQNIRVKTKDSGYLENLYSKLATNETKEKGIFLAGAAFNPMSVEDTLNSSNSAALKALKFLKEETYVKYLNNPIVDEEVCEGCKTCEEVCPYGAITLIDEKAKIEPMICTGCGACTVFCPVRAIEIGNYSHSLLSAKIETLLQSIKANKPEKPIILGIVCQECAYCAIDVAGMTGFKYPSNVYFIDVPCTGRVGIIELLKALTEGADAVLVAACPEESCHYQKGSKNAKNIVNIANSILKEIGYPEDLIFFETLVSNEPEKLVAVINLINSKFRPMEKEIVSKKE